MMHRVGTDILSKQDMNYKNYNQLSCCIDRQIFPTNRSLRYDRVLLIMP